jgi:hypothetical protein
VTTPEDGIEAERVAHEQAVREQKDRAAARIKQDALLAALLTRVGDLADATHQLTRASILSRIERIALFTIVLLVLGISVGVGLIGLSNRHGVRIVVDCTQPGGLCYQRAQDQTAAAVAQLNLVTIISAECADAYTGRALHDCIIRRVKAGK